MFPPSNFFLAPQWPPKQILSGFFTMQIIALSLRHNPTVCGNDKCCFFATNVVV